MEIELLSNLKGILFAPRKWQRFLGIILFGGRNSGCQDHSVVYGTSEESARRDESNHASPGSERPSDREIAWRKGREDEAQAPRHRMVEKWSVRGVVWGKEGRRIRWRCRRVAIRSRCRDGRWRPGATPQPPPHSPTRMQAHITTSRTIHFSPLYPHPLRRWRGAKVQTPMLRIARALHPHPPTHPTRPPPVHTPRSVSGGARSQKRVNAESTARVRNCGVAHAFQPTPPHNEVEERGKNKGGDFFLNP
jgi:hypothetical protein